MKFRSIPGLKIMGEDDDDMGFWPSAPNTGVPSAPNTGLPSAPNTGLPVLAPRNMNSSASDPVEISEKPALVSEAVESSSAQSGAITVTSMTSGGITINL